LFFDVVAKASSLTEAARELGVSVSSVSKRLTRIERRLGVHLIQRTTRRLALTTEGERYAAGAAVIAVELAGLEESLSEHGELVGRIRVHSTMGLGRAHIAPLVADFCTQRRRVQVDLELSPLPFNIADTTFDIAIRVGSLEDSRLTVKRLFHSRRVVCAAPSYLDRYGTPREPKDLQHHNCIVLRQDEGDYALWRFGTDADETAIRVSGNLSCNDGEVTTRWCVEGQGLIIVTLVDIRKQRSAVVFPTEGGWVWLSARTEFCCVSSAFPQPDAGRVFVDRCVEQSEESRHELTTVVHALFDKCAGRELRGVSQAPTRLRRCTVHGAQRVAVKHRHANR